MPDFYFRYSITTVTEELVDVKVTADTLEEAQELLSDMRDGDQTHPAVAEFDDKFYESSWDHRGDSEENIVKVSEIPLTYDGAPTEAIDLNEIIRVYGAPTKNDSSDPNPTEPV